MSAPSPGGPPAASRRRPLRVLLIANTLPPHDISGAGEQVLQLQVGLERAGHQVEVLGRGPEGARGSKLLFALNVVVPAWRRLRRLRPHVVQVHESDAALAALLVRLLRWTWRPRPVLVALLQVSYREERRAVRPLRYGGRVLGRPGRAERRFLRGKSRAQVVLGWLTARLADRVLACSRQTAKEVERDYGVRRAAVLYNVTGGLEPPKSLDPPSDLSPGYLLYVGRFVIRKGIEVLLEAMAQIPPGLQPSLALAGDGEHREALEVKVAELALGDQVRFLGRRSAAEVRGLLAGARALVVSSTYEGMPLVILEAMAAGVPVVATAVSGIPEVVVDGETGWVVPSEDPPRLAAALVEVLRAPPEAARRGAAGERRLREYYTPEAAASRWEEIVTPLLPSP